MNTIVADVLSDFADIFENSDKEFTVVLNEIVRTTIKEHKRIIFNGNNYSSEWVSEAERRGLLNLKTTVDALPYLISDKNIELFSKHKIYTNNEIFSRYEIYLENYEKTINIEALTMLDMVKKEIIPAVSSYVKDLAETAVYKRKLSDTISCELETDLADKLSTLNLSLYNKSKELEKLLEDIYGTEDVKTKALEFAKSVLPIMQEIRSISDELEESVSEKYWPFPTYADLLFRV